MARWRRNALGRPAGRGESLKINGLDLQAAWKSKIQFQMSCPLQNVMCQEVLVPSLYIQKYHNTVW